MWYLIVGICAFIAGYILCFKFFRDDILQGKPMVLNRKVYVASKTNQFK